MATRKFFIIDNPNGGSDGVIQTREKENVGFAYNNEAPNGMYISCSLETHWIITNEEYKQLKQCQKKSS